MVDDIILPTTILHGSPSIPSSLYVDALNISTTKATASVADLSHHHHHHILGLFTIITKMASKVAMTTTYHHNEITIYPHQPLLLIPFSLSLLLLPVLLSQLLPLLIPTTHLIELCGVDETNVVWVIEEFNQLVGELVVELASKELS